MSIDEKAVHYDAGGIETIKVIQAKLTPDQYRGYLLGNIIKYACRVNFKAAHKKDMRDIEKITIYGKILISTALEGKE